MRIARPVCCAAVAWVLLGPIQTDPVRGQSQTPTAPPASQAPTFKATTALVEVDFVVFDKEGRFVPGLMPEDLTLYEDGKKQNIQNFYLVSHDASLRHAPGLGSNGTPAEHARRVFVVLFDESHLAHESLMRAQKGAETFIQSQIGPGDVGGVFVNGQMYRGRLTTDKNELVAGVRSAKPAFENRQALLAPFREFPRIPTEIDAVRIEQGAREVVDQLGVEACARDQFLCQQEGGLQQVENLIQRKAKLYVRQARSLTARTVQNLQYVVSGLSRIPGRKTVMFLTEGFFVEESRDILQTVGGQAARAGTTIYSIDGRGLISTGANADPDVTSAAASRSTSFDTGEDAPFILTMATGGFTLRHMDDVGRAFNLIARDTSTYYVIGYQPANSTMDGTFRKIELKPNMDGLQIRARKGYVAMKLPQLEQIRGGIKN